MPDVGWLIKDDGLHIPERHLGLVPGLSDAYLDRLAEVVARSTDLEAVVRLAASAGPLPSPAVRRWPDPSGERFTLAVARDDAFWFYYQDGLDCLAALGADIVPFSPLHDHRPPAGTQAIYLGGGYPELHLEELAANEPMRRWLRETEVPTYAECGGLMYLTRAIANSEGRAFPMVGKLDTEAHMQGRGLRIGYVEAEAAMDHLLARRGEVLRGHEFHCSHLKTPPEPAAWTCRGRFGPPRFEGFARGQTLASYVHIHFAPSLTAAKRLAAAARLCKAG